MIYNIKKNNKSPKTESSVTTTNSPETESKKECFCRRLKLLLVCLLTLTATIGKISVTANWYKHTGSLSFILPDLGLSITSAYFLYIYIFKLVIEYKAELTKLKNRLNELTYFIDPIGRGLTITEVKLLETLCMYRESNAMLSARLGKSKSTVKVQLLSIFNKIGVDNRHDLIDSCKHYFNQEN